VAQKWDEVLQDLRDAAAVRGGVDVEHAAALGGLRERAQLLVALLADDFGVVLELLLGGDRNWVQLLDRAGEEALHEVPLQAEEDDQRNDHDEERARRKKVPFGAVL